MSLIVLHRLLRRSRRHLLGVVAVLAIAGAVAVHHAALDDMHMGMDDAAMVLCLAVLPAVAVAAVVALILRRVALPVLPLAPVVQHVIRLPLPRARSSPVATVVLRR